MIISNLSEFSALVRKNSCLLGLDYGSKVIGAAVSDPNFSIASPVASLERKKFADTAAQIARLISERKIGGIVIGLPKNMDGTEGPTAQAARAFARNLMHQGNLPDPEIPILFWDERLSTAAVERILVEDDMSRKRRDEVVDKMAAAYILQGVCDAIRHKSAQTDFK